MAATMFEFWASWIGRQISQGKPALLRLKLWQVAKLCARFLLEVLKNNTCFLEWPSPLMLVDIRSYCPVVIWEFFWMPPFFLTILVKVFLIVNKKSTTRFLFSDIIQNFHQMTTQHYYSYNYIQTGAIIGDGDRKRAPFLVLGLAPWYGTIFLFLEQIVPSPAAHARTCCEDFSDAAQGKWRPKFPKSFTLLAHYSTRLCQLEFCLSVFVVSCSSLSEERQCQI